MTPSMMKPVGSIDWLIKSLRTGKLNKVGCGAGEPWFVGRIKENSGQVYSYVNQRRIDSGLQNIFNLLNDGLVTGRPGSCLFILSYYNRRIAITVLKK